MGSRFFALYVCAVSTFAAYIALETSLPWMGGAAAIVAVLVGRLHFSPLISVMVTYLIFCLAIAPVFSTRFRSDDASSIFTLGAIWVIATCVGGIISGARVHLMSGATRGYDLPRAASLFRWPGCHCCTHSAGNIRSNRPSDRARCWMGPGLLSGVGPAFAAGALIAAYSRKSPVSSPGRLLALGLVGAQAVLLTLRRAFRGAAPFYVIAILISSSEVRDRVKLASSFWTIDGPDDTCRGRPDGWPILRGRSGPR